METHTITAIIVDDEEKAIANLENDLKQFEDIVVVDCLTSLQKAKSSLLKHQPDLIFIDIAFPDGNGQEILLEILPKLNNKPHIIFYSAFNRYIINALRASAFDFLLKPYQFEELELILNRVKANYEKPSGKIDQVSDLTPPHDSKFAVQTVNSLLFLRCSEILCFQYDDTQRCWLMTLTNLEQHRLRLNAKASDILNMSPTFIRVRTDCILNIDYVCSVENNTLQCRLCAPFEEMEIFASRRYYSRIKETMQLL